MTALAGSSRRLLTLREAALSYAHDFAHVREEGSNRGTAVEFFLRCANVDPGAPWCAAFVNACAELGAAIRDKEPSPLEQVKRQAFVADYVTWAKEHGRTVRPLEMEPGDIFCLWNRSKLRHAHMGFVDWVNPERTGPQDFKTIEGNSDEAGRREGVRVVARRRKPRIEDVFIRWND